MCIMEESGDELILMIANKEHDHSTAERAFDKFCARYDQRLIKHAEIQCKNLGYSSDLAFKAVECAFRRVWLYPTFDKRKSRSKDIDNGIILWLNKILYTQVLKFKNNGECADVNKEEDLSVINNAEEFYEKESQYNYLTEEEKKRKIKLLDQIMKTLDMKHRIIFLTYAAYHEEGKYLPSSLIKKLRTQLNLSSSTIRVYKKESLDVIKKQMSDGHNG